jgi:hypothetical protein
MRNLQNIKNLNANAVLEFEPDPNKKVMFYFLTHYRRIVNRQFSG